jgi:hypothetical protein
MLFCDFFPPFDAIFYCHSQVTRLLPDAVGTTCGQRLERVYGSEHADILRVPFRTEKGIVRQWISRFEVWPYLETYTEVNFRLELFFCSFPVSVLLPLLSYVILKLNNLLLIRMLELNLLKSYKGSQI